MRRRSDDGIIVGVGIQLSKATIMSDVTQILSAIEQGNSQSREQLLPLLSQVLQILPAQKMSQGTFMHCEHLEKSALLSV
ncbi:MAG: hypothetical protein IH899_12705 [Planctomycetes bacterium]|nr:hypothetical protein [Planctomycetota bacterium]